MKVKKVRLDARLVELKLAESLKLAKAYIGGGKVRIAGVLADKAGMLVAVDKEITVKHTNPRFASRAGEKLEAAILANNINLQRAVALDIGCAHGGFSDFLLSCGVRLIYAVDVGYPCLAPKLAQDPRIVYLPRTNFRKIDSDLIREAVDFVCIDVSFISASLILARAVEFMAKEAKLVVLIKPQFELPAAMVARGGVVRKAEHQELAINKVCATARENGLRLVNICPSPLVGRKKQNKEFLVYFIK